MLLFINLFIIPIISVSIYSRRSDKPVKLDFESLFLYVYFLVGILIICYVITKIPEVVYGIDIGPNSRVYSVVDACVAFILPYICEIYRKYVNIRCEIKGKNESDK